MNTKSEFNKRPVTQKSMSIRFVVHEFEEIHWPCFQVCFLHNQANLFRVKMTRQESRFVSTTSYTCIWTEKKHNKVYENICTLPLHNHHTSLQTWRINIPNKMLNTKLFGRLNNTCVWLRLYLKIKIWRKKNMLFNLFNWPLCFFLLPIS